MSVDIIVTSYNKGLYIREALLSVLNQKTDKIGEIIVSDDASTDESIAVIKSLQADYPGRIRLVEHKTNLGGWGSGNFAFAIKQCKSELIACLDGDDLYLDENKIEIMANILSANPELAGCVHDYVYIDFEKKANASPITNAKLPKDVYLIDDLNSFNSFLRMSISFHANFIMLRRETWERIFSPEFVKYYVRQKCADHFRYQIWDMIANGEKFLFINKPLATISSSQTSVSVIFGLFGYYIRIADSYLILSDYYNTNIHLNQILRSFTKFEISNIANIFLNTEVANKITALNQILNNLEMCESPQLPQNIILALIESSAPDDCQLIMSQIMSYENRSFAENLLSSIEQ